MTLKSKAPASLLAGAALGCATQMPIHAAPNWPADLNAAASPTAPAIAACALVHIVVPESLGNAAEGHSGDWPSTYSTFVLRTPRGVVLIDAGLGKDTPADVAKAPAWFRWSVGNSVVQAKPLGQLLQQAGIAPEEVTDVLLTHVHWDHTGGLRDLPKAKVWMADADLQWVRAQTDYLSEGAMPGHLAHLGDRLQPLKMAGPALLGFGASADVFGDGSVLAMPTPGHTRGATSYLVQSNNGKRWLFVGDAAWVAENYQVPVPKGRLVRKLVDHDHAQTSDTLGRLHALFALGKVPLVTAHDQRTWQDLPLCVGLAGAAAATAK